MLAAPPCEGSLASSDSWKGKESCSYCTSCEIYQVRGLPNWIIMKIRTLFPPDSSRLNPQDYQDVVYCPSLSWASRKSSGFRLQPGSPEAPVFLKRDFGLEMRSSGGYDFSAPWLMTQSNECPPLSPQIRLGPSSRRGEWNRRHTGSAVISSQHTLPMGPGLRKAH